MDLPKNNRGERRHVVSVKRRERNRGCVYTESDELKHTREFTAEFSNRYQLNTTIDAPICSDPIGFNYCFFLDGFTLKTGISFGPLVELHGSSYDRHCGYDLLPHPKHPVSTSQELQL